MVEVHVQLATAYNRLKRKDDADRERAIVDRLNAEAAAKQKGGRMRRALQLTVVGLHVRRRCIRANDSSAEARGGDNPRRPQNRQRSRRPRLRHRNSRNS